MWQTIGFEQNKIFFESVIKNGGLAHAHLFTGQEMIGKRTFALELAQKLQLRSSTSQLEIEPLNNHDVLFIDSSCSESGQTIAIEEIRKIKNFVALSPHTGKYKFVIIDDSDLMTAEAQNALLKILEEPNSSSLFFLISAAPEALSSTVISRCQEIKFAPHPASLLKNFLSNAGLSKIKTDFLIEFANGRLGLVKKVVEDGSYGEIKESVEELMSLIKKNINERLAAARELADEENDSKLRDKILYWTLYMHTRFAEPKSHRILKGLLALSKIVNKPQFNHRLALENFLVQL